MSLLRINLALILSMACLVGLTSTRELPSPFEPSREPIEVRLAADGGGLVDCWNALLELRSFPSPFEPSREPIEVRLAADGGGLVDCWNALLELRSCTNEIVLFFLNGESYLGLECCQAIRVITRQCWPTTMLSSLGFTSEEGDILRGYCDAKPAPPPDAKSTPPPPPVTAPTGSAVADGFATDELLV